MFNKEKFNDAVQHLGNLTDKQKMILEDARNNPIPEKELFEKLGVPSDAFGTFMKEASDRDYVLRQELSSEELAGVGGGWCENITDDACSRSHFHNIYEPGPFPDCHATVEDGSWCWNSDACYSDAIEYVGMKKCKKAWK